METLKKQAAKLLGEQKKYRRWMAVFLCLAVVVMAGTTAALKMNGQALSHEKKVLACGEEVHVHTAECYGSGIIPALVEGENALDREQPVCGYADYVVHVHGEGCFDEDGTLVCLLPEKAPHIHTESCFSKQMFLVCGQEETEIHQHTEVCRELICGQEETEVWEHQHTEACKALICGQEESEGHQHTEACRTVTWGELICENTEEGHEHTAECYEQIEDITCGMEESEGHTHTEECYDMQACGQEEGIEGHTHTEECYGPYICGFGEESEGHVHTDACYQVKEVLVCGELELHTHTEECCDAEGNLICGLPELKEHVHGEECFEIIQVEDEEEAETKLFQKVYEDADIRVIAEYTAEANIPEEAELVAERVNAPAGSMEESKEAAAEGTAESAEPVGEINEVAEVQEPETSESEADVQETDTTGSENASAADKVSEAGMEVVEEKVSYRLRFLVDGAEIEPEGTVSFIVQGLDGNGNNSGELVTLMYKAGDGLDTMVVTLTAQHKNAAIETEENVPSISENPEENDDATVDDGQVIKKVYADSNVRVEAVYEEAANIPEEAELTAEYEVKEVDETSDDDKAVDQGTAETGKEVQTVKEMTVKVGFRVAEEEIVPEDTVTFTIQMLDEESNTIGEPAVLVYNAGDSLDTLTAILTGKSNRVLDGNMNLSQTVETENYIVTVTYSEGAGLPEEAQLRVIEYAKDSEQYVQHCAELGYQPDGLLNIGFFVGDSEVEPKVPVNVKIADKAVSEADGYEIVHFTENGAEQVSNNTAQTENGMETEFSADSFSVYSVDSRQSVGYGSEIGEVDPIGDLVHEKYVEPTSVPGVYDLTLNVKGSVNGSEKAKVDIVFVVDTSGSMAWDVNGSTSTNNRTNPSRRALANTAITNLINDLDAANSGIDAQYKLITFSGSANTTNASNWQSGATLQNRLPGSASGGTNYEDALEEAGKAVAANNRKESGSKTIVIFLTDGAPTYSKTNGNGSSTTNQMVEHAQRGAAKITCDYFFAVGFGAEMTKTTTVGSSGKTAYQILEAVADATNAEGKNASATTDLTSYFDSFKESLKKIKATEVSFTDKLTNEVSIVDAAGNVVENPGAENWTPQIKNADGILLDQNDPEYTKAGMRVTYDSTNGLKVEFTGKEDDGKPYILKTDYTYEVTTKIAPNEAAKTKYENNSYSYTEWGEPNTGSLSSNQQGIRCNVNDSANVSYSYWVGDEKKEHADVAYPYPVVQLGDRPVPPPLVEQEMTHDKYIARAKDANGNELEDVYDLTLDLTGRVGSTTKKAYYDILFVVDTSGSMKNGINDSREYSNDNPKQRLYQAKSSIKGLIDEVEANTNIKAKYSLVSFGNDATLKSDWSTATSVKSAVNNLSADGGTNYQAALVKAGNQMTKNSGVLDDAPEGSAVTKVVVFLTDGEPTWHMCTECSWDWSWSRYQCNNKSNDNVSNSASAVRGGGNSTKRHDYAGAIMGAGAVKCNYFYSIGFGAGMTSTSKIYSNKTAKQVLEDVTNATVATVKNTVTTNDLQQAFRDIQGIITEFHCHNVTVTDTLSQYVEVNSIGTGENEIPAALNIKVTNYEGTQVIAQTTNGNVRDGASLPLAETSKNAASTITARYDKDSKQVILDFPDDYKLESGYKYYVTVQIRPSQTAYDEADRLTENGAVNYPHTGDYKTDIPAAYLDGSTVNKISDGQKGFYTNNKATVTFTYGEDGGDGERGEELYPHPVIRVNLAKLTVKKTVAGLTPEDTAKLFANMKFVIDGDTGNPVTAASLVDVTEHKDEETNETTYTYALKSGVTSVTNGDGSITYTILTDREVVPGTHMVTEVWDAADVDGYERTTSYKVNDGTYSEEVTGSGDIQASIALEANGTGIVEFKNSYEAITAAIQLSKSDGEGHTEPFDGLTFSVREGTVARTEGSMTEEALHTAIDELKVIATLIIGADGKVVSKTVADEYAEYNPGTTDVKKLVLPVGEYTVVEVRSGNALGNYAEVYPFEIKVLPNGNVEKNDILGYPNGENVLLEKDAGTEGTYYQLDVINRQMKLDKLQIVKISGQNSGTVLPDAVFDLYEVVSKKENGEVEGREIASNLKSDENGFLTSQDGKKALEGLESGKEYYLLEKEAPAGYMLSENKIFFSVVVERDENEGNLVKVKTNPQDGYVYVAVIDDGAYKKYDETDKERPPYIIEEIKNEVTGETEVHLVWTLAVTNNTGAKLPVTGGPGTVMYTLGGLVVIATSLVYGLSMRRKKRKGGSN